MRALVFDLDGTLWDPAACIAEAWNQVLVKHRIDFRPITAEDIRRVSGLPHRKCVETVFEGLNGHLISFLNWETQAEDKKVFLKKPIPLYCGVAEGIQSLSKRYQLFIVSNCQQGYIEKFLTVSELKQHFTDWSCWGKTEKPKPDNLAFIIEKHKLKECVFIGDSTSDEEAANACNVPFFWVNYGYGTAHRPQRIFNSFQEVTDYFMGLT